MNKVAALVVVLLVLCSCMSEQDGDAPTVPTESVPTCDCSTRPAPEVVSRRIEKGEPTPSSPYSWTTRSDLKSMIRGESALAAEQVECSPEGIFVIAAVGKVLQPPVMATADTSAGEATIVAEEIFASNLYVGASGSSDDRQTVEASIDPENFWCIPKREICYQEVEFGAFGLDLRKGRAATVPYERIYNLRLGIVTALQRVAVDHCVAGRTEV